MRTIQKILIANRGEIALRVARTCRSMGIACATVFSDDDESAVHADAGDEGVRLPGIGARTTYLSIDAIVGAAQRVGADAIHPGYGFLSENAELAAACEALGIAFIGPRAETIRAMGLKDAAKEIAAKAGVPVVPGYDGRDGTLAAFVEHARSLGYPVLVKAVAGGGGKGMRIVSRPDELPAAFEACQREAQLAFGNGALLLEKYIAAGRHIEVQILGDQHGNLVHLSERECSIQRRHQKIVEETPAPGLSDVLRNRICSAALDVARAIGYSSAGTVEFILAPSGEFYFLEVNARLQVEHPVTEMVTGVDLVCEQIRVARGESLSITQSELRSTGSAIECRVCAEDPNNGFLPATGVFYAVELPTGEGIRVDSSLRPGASVGVHYDSLLAKIVAHGVDRAEAIARMERALSRFVALGVRTNRAHLLDVIRSDAFREGTLDTQFLARLPASDSTRDRMLALVATTLVGIANRERARSVLPSLRRGFRNNGLAAARVVYRVGDATKILRYEINRDGSFAMWVDDTSEVVQLVSCERRRLLFEQNGVRKCVGYAVEGHHTWIQTPSSDWHVEEEPVSVARTQLADPKVCRAPMPGKVVRVHVRPGSVVQQGATLLVLEAMKMEHAVVAVHDAVVRDVPVSMGSQVRANEVLVVMEE